MKKMLVFLAVLVFIISSCTSSSKPSTITIPTFVEGSKGVSLSFEDFKKEVLDGGEEAFDITLKLVNNGAFDVPKDNIMVSLSGVRPQEFNKREEEFRKKAESDIISKKVIDGSIQDGIPEYIQFRGLNHISTISGASLQLPLQAEICYLYTTKAISVLCVKKDLLQHSEGVCKVEGSKKVANSASPLKVEDFKEMVRGKDRIGFSFKINHVGSGSVYEKFSSGCELDRKKNRVFVRISSDLGGLSCTGLSSSGKVSEGFITLTDSPRIVTCNQDLVSKGDYETPVNIELVYDYSEKVVEQLTIKHVGEIE